MEWGIGNLMENRFAGVDRFFYFRLDFYGLIIW